MDVVSYAASLKHTNFKIDELKGDLPKSINPAGLVAITFDDGFLENFTVAHPMLKERGLPATMFACTDWVTGPNAGVTGWCSLAQLLILQNEGWEIGSHSKTHTNLSTLTDAQVRDELSISKQVLEAAGLNIKTFGVPFGALPNNVDLFYEYYEQVAQSVGASTTLPPKHRCYYRFWPNNEQGHTVDDVKQVIIDAEKRGNVVVLGFHRFGEDSSGNAWKLTYFQELIDWLDPNKCFTFYDLTKAKADPSKRLVNKHHYRWGKCESGTADTPLTFTVADGFGWDYNDRSLGLDLLSPRPLQTLRIKCNNSLEPRMNKETIDIWHSNDNVTFTQHKGDYSFYHYRDTKNEDVKRTILINIEQPISARYWKIHQKHNDTSYLTQVQFSNEYMDVWTTQNYLSLT